MENSETIEFGNGLTGLTAGAYVDYHATSLGNVGTPIDYVVGDVLTNNVSVLQKVTAGTDTPFAVCLESKTLDTATGILHVMVAGKVQEKGLAQAFAIDEAWRLKLILAGLFIRQQ